MRKLRLRDDRWPFALSFFLGMLRFLLKRGWHKLFRCGDGPRFVMFQIMSLVVELRDGRSCRPTESF